MVSSSKHSAGTKKFLGLHNFYMKLCHQKIKSGFIARFFVVKNLTCFWFSGTISYVMSNKKKLYSILFSSIALICLAGFIWSYVVTADIRNPNHEKEAGNQIASVKNIVVTETKDGAVYWELYAEKGSYASKTGDVTLDKTMGNFYNNEQEVIMSFRSDYGIYSESSKTITLKGDSYVVAYDGSSIRADELKFQGKDEDILASGNVIIKRNDDFETHSDNARFNTKLTFFEISGNTETNVYTKDGSKTKGLTK